VLFIIGEINSIFYAYSKEKRIYKINLNLIYLANEETPNSLFIKKKQKSWQSLLFIGRRKQPSSSPTLK